MIERIIISILTNLGSWLLTKGLAWLQRREEKHTSEKEIDARVGKVKAAIMEVQDGKPATPEQKEKFKAAVRELIRGGSTDGGL